MAPEDPTQMLSRLTKRQEKILRLRCEGLEILPIADELCETEGVVKQEIGRIYVKLGLDKLTRIQRFKELFEKYCPALKKEAKRPTSEPESEELEPVPREVEEMIEEDEREFASRRQKPHVSITEPKPLPRRRSIRCLLVGVVLSVLSVGCVVCCAAGIYLWTKVMPGVAGGVIPSLAPPQGTSKSVGDEWSNDRVSLELTAANLNESFFIDGVGVPAAIVFHFEFRNRSQEDILLRFQKGDFTLVDNLGRTYPHTDVWHRDSATISVSEVIPIGGKYEFEISFGRQGSFDTQVSSVTVSVNDLSTLPFASWTVSVPE